MTNSVPPLFAAYSINYVVPRADMLLLYSFSYVDGIVNVSLIHVPTFHFTYLLVPWTLLFVSVHFYYVNDFFCSLNRHSYPYPY